MCNRVRNSHTNVIHLAVSHLLLHQIWKTLDPSPPPQKKNIYIYIQIYPRCIQYIQDKYKIPSGRRPGPGQARGGGRLVFCNSVGYRGYIFHISWYIVGIIFWANWGPILMKQLLRNCHLYKMLIFHCSDRRIRDSRSTGAAPRGTFRGSLQIAFWRSWALRRRLGSSADA